MKKTTHQSHYLSSNSKGGVSLYVSGMDIIAFCYGLTET